MDLERAKTVFGALADLEFHPPGRDEHHGLTDRLEIAAVAVGLKPTFLSGQSDPTDELRRQLATTGTQLGLRTLRGPGITDLAEIMTVGWPGVDPGYLRQMLDEDLPKLRTENPVLWVFADPALEAVIQACERGERPSSDVLGYPPCCTRHFMSRQAHRLELKLKAYAREYGANSSNELVQLERMGVGPSLAVKKAIQAIDDELSALLRRSLVRFPYVHFTACPACIERPDSPAAKINAQMQELAEAIDPEFAKRFPAHAEWYESAWREAERRARETS